MRDGFLNNDCEYMTELKRKAVEQVVKENYPHESQEIGVLENKFETDYSYYEVYTEDELHEYMDNTIENLSENFSLETLKIYSFLPDNEQRDKMYEEMYNMDSEDLEKTLQVVTAKEFLRYQMNGNWVVCSNDGKEHVVRNEEEKVKFYVYQVG